MKVMVNGRNLEITEYMREYVSKKVDRLERYLPQISEIRADLNQNMTRSADDRFTAQITIWANGQILRAEEATSDIFASVDATIDKISSQIRRFKGRRFENKRRAAHAGARDLEPMFELPSTEPSETEEPGYIIRRKQFLVEPMGEEEALEQMELLGHDFYVFFNPQTNGVNVIYRRRDGNYGLLIPATG
ncbi:MAG: ribosome-associated translation inhibitor RaiA [Caldilinea sp.]|jgi:putative sigma-54 modulation protein|nr:ribosome-associated translation inhibitor RaiA [Caldilinea sp.]